jgi:predicted nuclease of predicted toxin-antitoxin system
MRILLDECLPARLRNAIPGHEVRTVKQMGWLGIKNGRLLKLIAESENIDLFVTVDKNLPREQKTSDLPFALAVLRARSNRFEDMQSLVPDLLRRTGEVRPGVVLRIGAVG